MRTHFYAVSTEDTTIKSKSISFQSALSHHQRSCRANLHTGATRHTVRIVQADIEWCRDYRVKALTKHTITVWANYVVTNSNTLGAINALIGIA